MIFWGIRIDQLVGYTTLAVVALLVITRKLVWYKDLEKIEKARNDWQELALRLLGATEKITTQAEIITTTVLNNRDEGAGGDNAPNS